MKQLLSAALFCVAVSLVFSCTTPRGTTGTALRARLETKAMCMNYTFSLVEGTLPAGMVETSWTDETTKKTYTNAFGIANPCNFPDSINAGDEFYFTLDSSGKRDCAVCMAYYPTPGKKLLLKVIPRP